LGADVIQPVGGNVQPHFTMGQDDAATWIINSVIAVPLLIQYSLAYSLISPIRTAIAYELNRFPTIRGDFSSPYSHWVEAGWARRMMYKR
jgi:hypothetical protein